MRSADIASRANVPAFLTKLWRLLEDPKYDELISWNQNGLSFLIKDQSRFAKEVLPMYFKHSNMASFIRQLNMYGFHKLVKIEQGGMRCETDEMEFFHQYFIKGHESYLELIKRKQVSKDDSKVETVRSLMTDVKNLQGKQENVDNMMDSMKRENEALWREVAYLRQKHLKQQQIVEKLIQFLVTLVQPNVNVSLKRKLPLMINNSATGDSKIQRLARKNTDFHFNTNREENQKGPVIHDVTELLSMKNPTPEAEQVVYVAEADVPPSKNFLPDVDTDPVIQSPAEIRLESPHDISLASPLGDDMAVLEPLSILEPLQPNAPLSPSALSDDGVPESSRIPDLPLSDPPLNTPIIRAFAPEYPGSSDSDKKPADENLMQIALTEPSTSMKDPINKASVISDHLTKIESELDWLQQQLSGNTLNIDASTLLGVRGSLDPTSPFKFFGSDDSLLGSSLPSDSLRLSGGEITGNEVIQYAPSFLEDMEFNDDEFSLGSTDGDKSSGIIQTPTNPDLEKIMDGLLNEKST